MAYCSPSDLHAHGVPRGATPNPARVLASAVSNTCTLDDHGFATGDTITFRPAGDGAMPAGLVAGTTYYAQAETDHMFRVRATAGGAAITFTDVDPDDPIMVFAPLDKAASIAWADRMIDNMVTGQATPFDDVALYPDGVPDIIKFTSAELAAGHLLGVTGSASRSLADIVDAAQKRLERWSTGVPVRGTPDESRENLAVAATAPYCDRRGWSKYGGL